MINRALRLIAALLVLGSLTAPAAAQNTPTCTVNTDTVTPTCPTSTGWLGGVTCEHRTISCTTVNGVSLVDLGITVGYKTPLAPVGTIVFFSHSGGITPATYPGQEQSYASDYYNANFQVVQTQWDADWEDTGTSTKNVAYAAGRPAAFLNWVRYGSTTGGSGLYPWGRHVWAGRQRRRCRARLCSGLV